MDKNRNVTLPGNLARAKSWLNGLAPVTKRMFHSSPRRAVIVSVSVVAGLMMIAGGSVGVVATSDSSNDNKGFAEQVANNLFSNGRTKGGTIPPSASAPNDASSPEQGTPGATTTTDMPTAFGVDGTTPSTFPTQTPTSNAPALGTTNTGVVIQGRQGLALAINATRSTAAAGERVGFSASITDPTGGVLGLQWDFGDGTTVNSDPKSCSDDANRPTVNDGRADFDTSTSHIYRQPGAYTVRVTARTGSRCGTRAETDTVIATGSVRITGEPSMNGPANPTAEVTITSGGTPDDPHLGLRVKGTDTDGYISKIVIDWQDGALPQEVITYPLSGCKDPGTNWPSSTRDETPEHTYINGGVHNVTVTITSTGCDGSQSQQAIGVLSGVRVAGSMQSSTTSLPPEPADTAAS